MAFRFITSKDKILKYLKDKTLTYKRFTAILAGRSNIAYFKKEGYLDKNHELTSKGSNFVINAGLEYDKEVARARNE